MSDTKPTAEFSGSIPELYDLHLVPMLFEAYAQDLTRRVRQLGASNILEVAAGTGAVARVLASGTEADTVITATDLSPAMIEQARAVGTSRPVEWKQADAMALPFEDSTFDVVISQFGVMFVPDKSRGFAEMRRVLRPGGVLIFNVWDRVENNGFSNAVQDGLERQFPDDPPRFLPCGAFGYYDEQQIRGDMAAAGFADDAAFEALDEESHAATAELAAIALCQGGPVRTEIEERDPDALDATTAVAAGILRDRFGSTDLVAPMRAFIVTASRRDGPLPR